MIFYDISQRVLTLLTHCLSKVVSLSLALKQERLRKEAEAEAAAKAEEGSWRRRVRMGSSELGPMPLIHGWWWWHNHILFATRGRKPLETGLVTIPAFMKYCGLLRYFIDCHMRQSYEAVICIPFQKKRCIPPNWIQLVGLLTGFQYFSYNLL